MIRQKPSVDNIIKLRQRCVTKYSDIHKLFLEDQQYYELNFLSRLGLPIEFVAEGTTLPTGRNMVDAFVDNIDISNARVFVNKHGATKIAQENAEMMRKFYLGLIYRTNVESPISPWRIAAKHYALHGVAFFKTIWDADMWPDKPEQEDGESKEDYTNRVTEWEGTTSLSVPIIIQAVNPSNVMPDPDHLEPQYYFEVHQRLAYGVTQRYPHWGNPKGKDADKEVEWTEYWDDIYKCFLADDEPVLKIKGGVVKHKYGFPPYVPIDSGLGNLAVEGDLAMRYVGILRYMYDVLVSESRAYSVRDIVLKEEAWPWFLITGPGNEQVTEVSRFFGKGTHLPDGVKIELMRPQVPPEALFRQHAITSDIIASHAGPRPTRGLSDEGLRSGAQERLRISQGGKRYGYSADAFKNGTAKVLINCAHLYKNVVPGKVRLWARTPTSNFDEVIDKDLMTEPFTCYVEFAPISEEDEYRRHDDLERQIQSGLLTKKSARRQLSNVDPEALETEEEEEKIRNSPALNQAIDMYIGTKVNAAIVKRQAAEMPIAPAVPPTGQPPVPPIGQPPPPTGMPPVGQPLMGRMTPPITQAATPVQTQQNQLRGMRSPTPLNPNQGQQGGGRRYA